MLKRGWTSPRARPLRGPEARADARTIDEAVSLARRKQMKVVERQIEPAELTRATEVFLAGTAAEVTAVREIGPYRFTPGRITETLMQDYDSLVQQSPEAVSRVLA